MTSVPFNVGLNDNTRLSSRVLRPPGGGHTDIFGGDPEPPRGRRLFPTQASTMQQDEASRAAASAAEAQNGQSSQEAPDSAPPQPEAAKELPSPVEARETHVPDAAKAEAPKRVRVPPGGFSSGLW